MLSDSGSSVRMHRNLRLSEKGDLMGCPASGQGVAPVDLTQVPATLDAWLRWFGSFFEMPNRLRAGKRGYCDLRDFGDRLAELGGYITSSKHQRSPILWRYYAKYFAWYCGLATSGGLDLETYIWKRFPGLCPYCGERPCIYLYNPGLRVHRAANEAALKASPTLPSSFRKCAAGQGKPCGFCMT